MPATIWVTDPPFPRGATGKTLKREIQAAFAFVLFQKRERRAPRDDVTRKPFALLGRAVVKSLDDSGDARSVAHSNAGAADKNPAHFVALFHRSALLYSV